MELLHRDLGSSLQVGHVIHAIPGMHWYRVSIPVLGGISEDIECCRLTETSLTPFGVKDTSPLPSHSKVLVYRPRMSSTGIIMGVVPDMAGLRRSQPAAFLSSGSHAGYLTEPYYRAGLSSLADYGSVRNFGAGRPIDALSLGEWGRINDLGSGLLIDLLWQFFRIDETCGLTLYYLDRLARLCGHNFDLRTAISNWEVRQDEGEAYSYHGFAVYPWEALGLLSPYVTPGQEISDAAIFEAPLGKLEPAYTDQEAFHRYQEYKGYLGQGSLRQLLLPPQVSHYRRSEEQSLIGVFREQTSLDGAYLLQSAHSISLVKRIFFPVAKRVRACEDPTGDLGGQPGYRFSGEFDEGPAHSVSGNIPVSPGSEAPQMLSAAALLDFAAYSQWKGKHPFYYHKKDYHLSAQSELPAQRIQAPLDYSSLAQKNHLDPPQPVPMNVDHRYGNVDYYETTAGVFILPDGSVAIRDGYGSEIKLSGGNAYISCPKNVYFLPGCSAVTYAGDDVVLRARNSADISATEHDVRIQANYNIEMLSGSSQTYGRTLIENQASYPYHDYEGHYGEDVRGSGILFKAVNAQIIGWANEVYLNTVETTRGGSPGDIVLDAGSGQAGIYTVSSTVNHSVQNGAFINFGAEDEEKTESYSFYPGICLAPGRMVLGGGLDSLSGGIYAVGDFVSATGHIFTSRAEEYEYQVGGFNEEFRSQIAAYLGELQEAIDANLENLSLFFQQVIIARYWEEQRIGNDEFIQLIGFSFRTEEQYGTTEFFLPEAYWQQNASAMGLNLPTWKEKAVQHQGEDTYPHPGKPWVDAEPGRFYRVSSQLVENGIEKPFGTVYEELEPLHWEKTPLDGNYTVIAGIN